MSVRYGKQLVRWTLLAAVMGLLVSIGSPAVRAQSPLVDGSPPGAWVNLGPPGAVVLRSAVSREWPSDQMIAVLTATDMRVTTDGGQTWAVESLPTRDGESASGLQSAGFTIAPQYQGVQAIFLIWGDLWRSSDAGRTWERALRLNQKEDYRVGLTFSPTYTEDGTALVRSSNGSLSMTRDGGATWTTVEPVTGQRVQQVAFAPDFEHSRTMVASVVSGPFPYYGTEQRPEQATHHENSAGVVLSEDGGQTWQTRSAGLDVDGVPYRFVNTVALSPAFPTDNTLFAFSWGPVEAVTTSPTSNTRPVGLFRSVDRGANWSLVWHRPAAIDDRSGMTSIRRYTGHITIWPDFQQRGRAQLSLWSTNGAPSGGYCEPFLTIDHGVTWIKPQREPREPGCSVGIVGRSGSDEPVLISGRDYRSRDGGATWEYVAPPGHAGDSRVVASGYSVPDGSFFLAGRDGLWVLPPDRPPISAP